MTLNRLFKKTYENVKKFNEEKQKAYLNRLIELIDVIFDERTNEHTLDIRFQFPAVNDLYIQSSDKKGKKYKIKNDKYVNTVKGNFKSKLTKISEQNDLEHVLWKWDCCSGVVQQ